MTKFKNVICPWQTQREIRAQQKFLEKMLKKLKLDVVAESALLGLDRPDRVWNSKGS